MSQAHSSDPYTYIFVCVCDASELISLAYVPLLDVLVIQHTGAARDACDIHTDTRRRTGTRKHTDLADSCNQHDMHKHTDVTVLTTPLLYKLVHLT